MKRQHGQSLLTSLLILGIGGIITLNPLPAYAACSAPVGGPGDVIYNADYKMMQFCDGTNWIAMGGGGGGSGGGGGGADNDTLGSLSCVNGQIPKSNGSVWTCAADGSQWITTGSDIYYSTGKVGIGTSSPSDTLHVEGTTRLVNTVYLGSVADTRGVLSHSGNIGNGTPGVVLQGNPTKGLLLRANGNVNGILMDAAGNIGVGTPNPAAYFHVMSPSTEAIVSEFQRSGYASVSQLRLTDGGLNFFMSSNSGSSYPTAPALFLKDNGAVGIGTSAPGAQLDVNGGIVFGNPVRGYLGYYNVSPYNQIEMGVGSGNPTTSLSLVTNGISRMNIDPSGNVGIGTVTPAPYKLNVVGETYVGSLKGGGTSNFHIDSHTPSMGVYLNYYSTGNVFARNTLLASSDMRLKKDIEPIENALDKISVLKGVYFNWKDPARTGRQVGLIAQDVEEVFPELVKEDSEGYKTVSYPALVAPLINAVKELEVRQKKLEEENQALRDEIKTLEGKLESLSD